MAIVSDIIRFENGEMNGREIVTFFSGLVQSGMAWKLQASYGGIAKMLINSRVLNNDGTINQTELDNLDDREEHETRLLNGEE